MKIVEKGFSEVLGIALSRRVLENIGGILGDPCLVLWHPVGGLGAAWAIVLTPRYIFKYDRCLMGILGVIRGRPKGR